MENEKSRSRSPIVGPPSIESALTMDQDLNSESNGPKQNNQQRQHPPVPPRRTGTHFHMAVSSQLVVPTPSLVQDTTEAFEQISLKSFERRRSIYELGLTPGAIEKQKKYKAKAALAQATEEEEDENGEMEEKAGAGEGGEEMQLSEDESSISLSSGPSFTSVGASSIGAMSVASPGGKKLSESERKHQESTGFEIVWLNFTYSVEPNIFEDPRWGKVNSLFHKEHRTILKGISGGLRSGQMVALMGPSGAGKTCLLESISGTRVSGIGGELRLRGRKRAQLVIVPQYDNFMPQFTVEETIVFGSRMKNPPHINHQQVANEVIEQLGLQVCRKNNIQRCSGGQRKRVAIAQELVSRPNILILDEPTSGLDSSCCYQTMRVLRDVLDQSVEGEEPMAIVTTIHQPSAKVFKMFDLVYLLGKTGFTAYSGSPNELLATIRDVTGLECPQYSNPSDFMIELVSYDYGEEAVEKLIEFEKEKAREFVKEFEQRVATTGWGSSNSNMDDASEAAVAGSKDLNLVHTKTPHIGGGGERMTTKKLKPSKSDTHLTQQKLDSPFTSEQFGTNNCFSNGNNYKLIKERINARRRQRGESESDMHLEYKQNVSVPLRKATSSANVNHPFFWHTLIHIRRSYLQSIRDPILNNMRILIHIGFALLLVLLFGKKSGQSRGCPPILGLPTEITDPNNDSMIDLADNVGYLFMSIMMITYVSLMSTVLTFPVDIKTVGKEYKNGWYGTLSYFIGRQIADLPFIIVYPVIFCLIIWYSTDQAQDHLWRFFSFTGLVIMNAMNSQSFGLILGSLFVNSVTAATFLGPVITIPWYLFTGFTKRVHRLAEPYRTTSKFLFTRYVFEGLLDTVYGHERCNCSAFLHSYYTLREEEAMRLGQLISAETLSSLDYYDGIDVIAADMKNYSAFSGGGTKWLQKTVDAASTVLGDDLNLANLTEMNVKANSLFSFGLDFEPTCPANYKNYIIQDFKLNDKTVENAFIYTFIMLVVGRVLTFIIVNWKIRTRQL